MNEAGPGSVRPLHTEHLRNVQPSWIAFGWFLGFAVASGLLLMLAGAGLLDRSRIGDALGVALSVAAGWGIGGFITGYRTNSAPLLHGIGMALFTFVAWFGINLFFGGITTGAAAWEGLTVRIVAVAVLVQGLAGILGCWAGYRYAPPPVK